jgi:FMN phosphatase YigB (HAD superfamily)
MFNSEQKDIALFSLFNFKDIIQAILLQPSVHSVCEIGTEKPSLSLWLSFLAKQKDFNYCKVNPHLNTIPIFKEKNQLVKDSGLNYLKNREADYDVFLLDSDPNYYTLYHELKAIFNPDKNRQSVCLIHNILHPFANRDFYTNISQIPKEFIQDNSSYYVLNPHLKPENYGFQTCSEAAWAIKSGNPKNGTATAIKDFFNEYRETLGLVYMSVPLFHGLGILYSEKLIKAELKPILTYKNIYRILANEDLFRQIEESRMKLCSEVVSLRQAININSFARTSISLKKTLVNLLTNQLVKLYKIKFTTLLRFSIEKANNSKLVCFKEILTHADKYKVISLDFFDTLVDKLQQKTKAIQLNTAEYASIKLRNLGYNVDKQLFYQLRKREERNIKKVNSIIFNEDYEADFFSVINNVLFLLTNKRLETISKVIIDYELANQIKNYYVQDEIIDTLSQLKAKNKIILVCADTYLLVEQIKSIAKYFKFYAYIDLFYVSSHYKLTKSSGRLYDIILKELNVAPQEMMHIGTHFMADYIQAKEKKINAYRYQKNISKKYVQLNKRACKLYIPKLKLKKPIVKNTINRVFQKSKQIDNLISLNNSLKKLSSFIYPTLSLFIYQVILDLSFYGIKTLFFLERNSLLFKEIFDIILQETTLFKHHKTCIHTKLLDISDLASVCGNYQSINDLNSFLKKITDTQGYLSIKTLLENYGLTLSDFSQETIAAINDYYTRIVSCDVIKKLLKESCFGTELDKLMTDKRKLLERYLHEQGLFSNGRVGLIAPLDWCCAIQKNISHFLATYESTEFFGFYFASNIPISHQHQYQHMHSTLLPSYISLHANQYKIKNFKYMAALINDTLGFDQDKKTIGYQLTKHNTVFPVHAGNINVNFHKLFIQNNLKSILIADIKNFIRLFHIENFAIEIAKTCFTKPFLQFSLKKNAIKKHCPYYYNNEIKLII